MPVRRFTLVISNVSLNRKRALSFTAPCAHGIETVTCRRNIRSVVARLDRPSIICSNSRKVCCCCSSSRLSRSVQFINSRSSWISFCASRSSLWSGCDCSGIKPSFRCYTGICFEEFIQLYLIGIQIWFQPNGTVLENCTYIICHDDYDSFIIRPDI